MTAKIVSEGVWLMSVTLFSGIYSLGVHDFVENMLIVMYA